MSRVGETACQLGALFGEAVYFNKGSQFEAGDSITLSTCG